MNHTISLTMAGVLCCLTQVCLAQQPSPRSVRVEQLALSDGSGHYLLIDPPNSLTGNLIWKVPLPPVADPTSGFVGVGISDGAMLTWDNTPGSQQWMEAANLNWNNSLHTLSADNFSATGIVTSSAISTTELRGSGTSSGSPGNDASYSGSIAVADPVTSYPIVNSKVKPTSSIILTYVESSDIGHSPAGPIAAWVTNLTSGSFTIQLSAAPPAASATGSRVCYMIVNP